MVNPIKLEDAEFPTAATPAATDNPYQEAVNALVGTEKAKAFRLDYKTAKDALNVNRQVSLLRQAGKAAGVTVKIKREESEGFIRITFTTRPKAETPAPVPPAA